MVVIPVCLSLDLILGTLDRFSSHDAQLEIAEAMNPWAGTDLGRLGLGRAMRCALLGRL